jgi:hypothetical protein
VGNIACADQPKECSCGNSLSRFNLADNTRRIADNNSVGWDIVGEHAPRADDCSFPNRYTAEDRSVAADGGAVLDERGDTGPICLRLQCTRLVRGGGELVVYENHAVTNKDAVFNGHPLADEGMAGDFHLAPDLGSLLNLHERADPGPVAYFAAV